MTNQVHLLIAQILNPSHDIGCEALDVEISVAGVGTMLVATVEVPRPDQLPPKPRNALIGVTRVGKTMQA